MACVPSSLNTENHVRVTNSVLMNLVPVHEFEIFSLPWSFLPVLENTVFKMLRVRRNLGGTVGRASDFWFWLRS